MATRREIAEAAKVSVRTVSNVANGFEHVAPETRDRVLRAIQELQYTPSAIARSLRVGRSGIVGLMLPELDTPYFAELARAFVEEGNARELMVVVDQTDGDLDRERAFMNKCARGSLFDAVIANPLTLAADDVRALQPAAPIVFLGEDPSPSFDKVMIDNAKAAHDAVEHLVSRGRRRIAVIGAERAVHGSSMQRLNGYRAALVERGYTTDPSLVEFVSRFSRAEGAAALHRLMALPEPPDAVFCFSDPLALGAIRAAHEEGLALPEQLAIVGFDDVEDGRFATPSLTSISPDKRWLAHTAFERIARRLAGETLEPEVLIGPHRLVVRESSAGRPRSR